LVLLPVKLILFRYRNVKERNQVKSSEGTGENSSSNFSGEVETIPEKKNFLNTPDAQKKIFCSAVT
jgi:hypothetical protein